METDPVKREAIRPQALRIRAALRSIRNRLRILATRVLAKNYALPLQQLQATNVDLNDIRDASDALVALGGDATVAEGTAIREALRTMRGQLLVLANATNDATFEISAKHVQRLFAAHHEIRAACMQLFRPGEFFDGAGIEEERATPEQELLEASITKVHRPRAIGMPDA